MYSSWGVCGGGPHLACGDVAVAGHLFTQQQRLGSSPGGPYLARRNVAVAGDLVAQQQQRCDSIGCTAADVEAREAPASVFSLWEGKGGGVRQEGCCVRV